MESNWLPENYFRENQFLYMTRVAYQPYPLVYHNRSNKEILTSLCKLIRKICPNVNYTTRNELQWKIGDKINICFISDSLTKDTSVLRDRMGIIKNLPDTIFNISLKVLFYLL